MFSANVFGEPLAIRALLKARADWISASRPASGSCLYVATSSLSFAASAGKPTDPSHRNSQVVPSARQIEMNVLAVTSTVLPFSMDHRLGCAMPAANASSG